MMTDRFPSHLCRGTVAVMLAATALAAGASRAAAQQDTAVTFRPGLLIHSSAGVAYTMAPGGGVAAVDLATGSVRWTSTEGAKPLALIGTLLVTQVEPRSAASRLELASLNTQARGARVARATTDLPQGVRVAIGETIQGTFRTEARRAGANAVVVWSFVRTVRETEGDSARPREGIRAALPAVRRGAVSMNPSTGALTRLDSAAATFPRSPRWVLAQADKLADAPGTQYESADGRHVLATEVVGDDRVWDKYRWTIYERATRRRVGQIRTHLPFAPFVVRDALVVFETTPYTRGSAAEEPAKLRAWSLTTGQEAWAVPVREVVNRGPFPS
jgi:hypothetical protein